MVCSLHVMAMVAPLAFLIWQFTHGHITDLDVHLREQRKASLLVTIAGFAAAWVASAPGERPSFLNHTRRNRSYSVVGNLPYHYPLEDQCSHRISNRNLVSY